MAFLVNDSGAGSRPAPSKPTIPDQTGRKTYIDYVYGGLVANTPKVQKAIADQYDYNMQRTLVGKKPLTIADASWNPNAYDDQMNEWMAERYHTTGKLPSGAEQLDYMQQAAAEKRKAASLASFKAEAGLKDNGEDSQPPRYSPPNPAFIEAVSTPPRAHSTADPNIVAGGLSQMRGNEHAGMGNAAQQVVDMDAQRAAPLLNVPTATVQGTGGGLGMLWGNNINAPGTPSEYQAQTAGQRNGVAAQVSGGTRGGQSAQDATARDSLLSVMTPEQLSQMSAINDQVLDLFTDVQKQQITSGQAEPADILDTLDDTQRKKLEQLRQIAMDTLSYDQKTDLLFLNSYQLSGIDLQTRQEILRHLKQNDGKITFDDLKRLGAFQSGELATGGFGLWLQNVLPGGPKDYNSTLELEYRLNKNGTSIDQLDEQERQRRADEVTMLFAMAAAPTMERMMYGPSVIPFDDKVNNVYDNIERYGTQGKFKGGSPAGKGVPSAYEGAGDSWYKADGSINLPPNYGAIEGTEKIIDLQPGSKLGRFGIYGKNSDFVTAPGSAAETLSLPPYTDTSIYQEFTVLKPIPEVTQSTVRAWGGSVGRGTQYKLPMTIEELIRQGYLRK